MLKAIECIRGFLRVCMAGWRLQTSIAVIFGNEPKRSLDERDDVLVGSKQFKMLGVRK